MVELIETRRAMAVGIRAGKALLRAENALGNVGAVSLTNDFNTIVQLREARCELNHLAREISKIVEALQRASRTQSL